MPTPFDAAIVPLGAGTGVGGGAASMTATSRHVVGVLDDLLDDGPGSVA